MADWTKILDWIFVKSNKNVTEKQTDKTAGELIYGAKTFPSGPQKQLADKQQSPHALTDPQLANIIFNETRSLSGPGIEEARRNIGHAVLNGETRNRRRPRSAPDTVRSIPKTEENTYQQIEKVVQRIRADRRAGFDPSGGAIYFNFRNGDSTDNWKKVHPVSTQIGPFKNSYPTIELDRDDIFSNTYHGENR